MEEMVDCCNEGCNQEYRENDSSCHPGNATEQRIACKKGYHSNVQSTSDDVEGWEDDGGVLTAESQEMFQRTQSDEALLMTKRPKAFEEYWKDHERKEGEKNKKIDDFEYKGRGSEFRETIREEKHTGKMKNRVLWGVVLTAAIVAVLGYSMKGTTEVKSSSKFDDRNWSDAEIKWTKEVDKLFKMTFPLQDRATRFRLESAVRSTLSSKIPRQPSSLVLLIPSSFQNSDFPLCFAMKFAKLTNSIFAEMNSSTAPAVFNMDLNYFNKYGKDITAIHDQLKTYFLLGGKTIVIQDAEKLQEEKHLLIFHALCDNYMAFEKRATVFFLIPVPESMLLSPNHQHLGEISSNVLDQAWKNAVSDDSRPALIARVAADEVLLIPGDYCSL